MIDGELGDRGMYAKIRGRKKEAERFAGGPRLHCVLGIFQCVVSKSFLQECFRLLSVQVPTDTRGETMVVIKKT